MNFNLTPKQYAKRWFTPMEEDRTKLRDQYGHNFQKYHKTYQYKGFTYFHESGMEYFVKLEKSFQRRARTQPFFKRGQELLSRFGTELSRNTESSAADLVIVAIDFEGTMQQDGIKEFGIAEFDTGTLLSESPHASIDTKNYSKKKSADRKFVFGQSVRTHLDVLPPIITEYFEDLHRRHEERNIVLVCHGIEQELRNLDDLGIHLEDLEINGILDTVRLSKELLGRGFGLSKLLSKLKIPWTIPSLHCAGNEAHYTLQVLLALTQIKYNCAIERLKALITQPVPNSLAWSAEKSSETDWDVHLDGNMCVELST